MNILELIAGPIFEIIKKLVPDPTAQAQMQLQVLQMHQAGEFKEVDTQLQRDLAQIGVNNTEAQSPDLFRGGWRPAIGWACVLALVSDWVVRPYIVAFTGMHWPEFDVQTIMGILTGMLGLGTLRTTEKLKGVA